MPTDKFLRIKVITDKKRGWKVENKIRFMLFLYGVVAGIIISFICVHIY